MSEWQDIETWPKTDGEQALVWTGGAIELAMYDAEAETWWVLVEYTVTPTHWMPLPTPPSTVVPGGGEMTDEEWQDLQDKAARLAEFFGARVSSAVDRKASEIAAAHSVVFEELEEHGDDGENKSTYRKLARETLGLARATPFPGRGR